MWSKSQSYNSPGVALRRRHPVLAFALADQGKPLWSGRQMPEAMAWRVCQYKGVSSSPDLPGGTAGRPLADSSLSSFVIRRPRTCRLCGAVGAASTSCRRGSSLTSTSGHYGPRPATTRIAPRRRVDSIPRSDNAANDRPAPKQAVSGGANVRQSVQLCPGHLDGPHVVDVPGLRHGGPSASSLPGARRCRRLRCSPARTREPVDMLWASRWITAAECGKLPVSRGFLCE